MNIASRNYDSKTGHDASGKNGSSNIRLETLKFPERFDTPPNVDRSFWEHFDSQNGHHSAEAEEAGHKGKWAGQAAVDLGPSMARVVPELVARVVPVHPVENSPRVRCRLRSASA